MSSKRVPNLAGVAIPLTLVAIHFAIATLSGSSVNPARSIGSALVGGDLSQLWIYIVGPIVGGVLGYGIYRVIDEDDAARPDPTCRIPAPGPRSSRPRGPRGRTAGRCPSGATPAPG